AGEVPRLRQSVRFDIPDRSHRCGHRSRARVSRPAAVSVAEDRAAGLVLGARREAARPWHAGAGRASGPRGGRRTGGSGARMIGSVSSPLEQSVEVRARFDKLKQRPVILQVRGLSKTFTAPGRPPTTALEGISFDLHRRELACVIGPSGCGKSTLARLVAGLEQPTSGEMLIDGKQIYGPGSDRGMVLQSYAQL